MPESIGVRELRHNLSSILKRVEAGERIVITSHNRPIAELAPPPRGRTVLDRLVAEGKASAPTRHGPLPPPLKLDLGEPNALSKALEKTREDTV